ncbi:MAG: phenylacetic acid degradation protein PaaN [Geminicoccaceae bacterium]
MSELYAKHEATLEAALTAIQSRGFWSAYPEIPSGRIYGETAAADGKAAFEARLNRPFQLDRPTRGGRIGAERSPYGFDLGVAYPAPDVDAMLAATTAALPAWRRAGIDARIGVVLEILQRLHRHSFELAHAVMHTTGQGFMMAFQAGAPHAQDRGLEAVAYAVAAMRRVPEHTLWEKPAGKDKVERFRKVYEIVPQGIGLVIGCATFPTWNSYGALFANLVCGNPVLVKPHPRAVLPLAITVETARAVLAEAGHDPSLVQLVVDTEEAPIAQDLAVRPEIRLVDFTGSSAFGDWLEAHCPQAQVRTEKAGVNPVVVHSTGDFKGMIRNLAFSLSLYSGQMCTTPQNLFVPEGGIDTDEGRKSFDEVTGALAVGVDKLLGDAERACEVLGCIQSPATLTRIDKAAQEAGNAVLRASTPLTHPAFPDATVRTPLMLRATTADRDRYLQELFGPISFAVACRDADEALAEAAAGAKVKGAITAAVYSTDEAFLHRAEEAMLDAGVALSENLTGGTFVNQSAAFSDYHVSGANPAGNASLTDDAFVAGRFRIVQRRQPVA